MKPLLRCSLVFLLLVVLVGRSFAHGITNWPENKMGAVSLTFDDGLQSQLSLVIPALDARGIKGTFYVITNGVNTWEPWRNAAAAKHEIGSHTKSHLYLTDLSIAQMHDEMNGSKTLIDAQITSSKVLSIAYPYGSVNSDVSTVAREYYFAGRGIDCRLNKKPYDLYNVKACSPDSLDNVYYQADAAEQQGNWLVTYFHNLDGTGYGDWDIGELENYLDYLKTRNLWVGSFDAVVKYIREKANSSLSVSSSSTDQIVLMLTDTLDDAIYDQPLTLRSEVPSGWSSVKVEQGGTVATILSNVEGSTRVVYYSAVPDRGPISLTMSAMTGNIAPIAVIEDPVQNTTVNKGVFLNFSGNGTDSDGNLPLTYRWRFGADSGIPDSTAMSPGGVQFNIPGNHSVTLTVTDSLGLSTATPATRVITVLGSTSEVVIDNGGSGTSYTGGWDVSGASGPYGTNSFWSRDGSKYTWSFTPSVTGNYDVSMWWTTWPSRSTAVPVDITHSSGTARVTINQQGNGGKWNSLGSYSLISGVSYTVTVTSQPGPSSTCADAVKFAYLDGGGGGVNQPPVAGNDTSSTTQGTPVAINVISNDTDDAGIDAASVTIVTSPSNGIALPNGSGSVTYTPNGTFTGTDTFRYTVADGQGAVSNTATVTVTVNTVSVEVVIDNGDPGTSYTGGWDVSGASGPYGTNSFWSRDGAKYTWSFTPSITGNYDVSMWWTTWPSRSTAVPVDIKHSGGTARVTINQQANGGMWNSLGSYSLVAGVSYTVTVTSQPGPSSTCADAVKFALLDNAEGYVAVGDSITFGSHDDISSDGTGFEPILGNLLAAAKGIPVTIANEGVSGATSADGVAYISSTLAKYPTAKYYLVMYGTNDAYLPALPSGMGLIPGDAGYSGSFKDNMQRIVSAILAGGKTPYLAEVPYTSDPLRSNSMIYEYNAAIDELFLTNNILVTPPAFYAYFQFHQGEMADGIHPNGTGYQSMADLWFGALTK